MIWGGIIVQLTQCQIIWALWHVVLSLWTQPWSAAILRMWPLDNAHLVLSDPKYGHKMSSTRLHHLLFQVTLFQIFPIWLILSYSSLQQQKATCRLYKHPKPHDFVSLRACFCYHSVLHIIYIYEYNNSAVIVVRQCQEVNISIVPSFT